MGKSLFRLHYPILGICSFKVNSTPSVTIPGNSDLGLTDLLLFLVTKRALMQIGEQRIGSHRYNIGVGYNLPLHPGQGPSISPFMADLCLALTYDVGDTMEDVRETKDVRINSLTRHVARGTNTELYCAKASQINER